MYLVRRNRWRGKSVRETSWGAVVIVHVWDDEMENGVLDAPQKANLRIKKNRQDVVMWKWRKKTQSVKTPRIKKFSCIKGIILEYLTYLLNWAPYKDKNRDPSTIGYICHWNKLQVFVGEHLLGKQSTSANLI